MKNKHFIIEDLKKVKLYNKFNLDLIQNYTRNGKVKVFKDNKKNFFFLDKILTLRNDFYKYKYHTICQNNGVWRGKFYGKAIISPKINENKKRISLLKKFIFKKKILDFGCGFGDFINETSKISKKSFAYEKSNICKNYISREFKKIKIINNLENYNDFFDTVILIQTLHYLPEQIKCLINLKKKLKKKGKIIIEVPSANDILLSKFNLQKFKDFTFCIESLILHNKDTLKKFLKKAGFKKIKIFFTQRYNLNNHLGWLLYEKPGGHEFLKNFCNKKQRDFYEKFLKKNEMTDTLLAIAEK